VNKIIIVGQTPARRSKEPLDGAAGRRLAALAGLDLADFLGHFVRVNLLDQEELGAAEATLRAGRERADALREKWLGRKAVLLGRGVAAAFRLIPDDYQWFKAVEVPPGVEVAVMPHPSGISTWWNDEANVAAAREFMLRAKLGFLRSKRQRDPREQFTVEQVAAALEVGRGIYTWAAEALAEETGRSCCASTILNYINRYPDELRPVCDRMKVAFFGKAARNIVQSVENGDVQDSWRAWQIRAARDTMDKLGVNMVREISTRIDGRLEHDHEHRHAHLHAKLADMGLDLSRYSDEQLDAIDEVTGLLDAPSGKL